MLAQQEQVLNVHNTVPGATASVIVKADVLCVTRFASAISVIRTMQFEDSTAGTVHS